MAKAKKKPDEEKFYVWQRSKATQDPKPYVVMCGPDSDNNSIILGEYATLSAAEAHAARLNAANEPPPPTRYFCLDGRKDNDGEDVYIIQADRELLFQNQTKAVRLVNLINQLITEFIDGTVG